MTACFKSPNSALRASHRACSSSVGLIEVGKLAEIWLATLSASAFLFTNTMHLRPAFAAATVKRAATVFAFGVRRTVRPEGAPAKGTGEFSKGVVREDALFPISQ